MTEPTQEEIISIVYSIFDVKDMLVNPEDLQFKIDDNNFKDKFVSLARQLEFRNRVARLEKSSRQFEEKNQQELEYSNLTDWQKEAEKERANEMFKIGRASCRKRV